MAEWVRPHMGAGLALIVGLNDLLNPRAIKSLLGLDFVNTVRVIEIRVLFGRFLVALSVAAIIKADATVFKFYGIGALSAAIIKSIYSLFDKC